jgi:hypothetical protein
LDLESIEKLFALMRDHGVLRVDIDGHKVEMDPTLLGSVRAEPAQLSLDPMLPTEKHVAGGTDKRKAQVNPLLRHKSLGLQLEFEKPIAP